MERCSKCLEFKPRNHFGSRTWINADGSKTYSKKSHCRVCVNESNLKRYHKRKSTKEAHKTASYRYRIKSYGLTLDEYEGMLRDQEGLCFVCGSLPQETLHIDHCHKTGKVRKLLCNSCNAALGHSKEDINILERLIEYIKEHN